MHYSLEWKAGDLQFFVAILIVTAGFMAYYFMSKSAKLKQKFTHNLGEEKTIIRWVIFERMLGVFFFGIIPLSSVVFIFKERISHYGIAFENLSVTLYWSLGLSPLILILGYVNRKKEDNLSMYPQIRTKEWDLKLLILSALSWIAYLLAYEFMFRGYLLFVSLQYLGVWPAIALNIAIYSLVHIPKGIKETVGALPLGVVLGIVTIQTGNMWMALIVHIIMALSNEWFSLWAHPDMKFVKKKNN